MNNQNQGVPGPIENLKKSIMGVLTKLSKMFDRIVYSKKSSVFVSFIAAVMICITINFEDISYEFFNKEDATLNVPGVTVEVKVDEEKYQVNGLPKTVDLVLTGSPADIQSFRNNNTATVVVDLRKFKEGENVIPLEAKNIPSQLKVTVMPDKANVEIEKKVSKSFIVKPELLLGVGQKMEDFETPILGSETVVVRATQEKINSIRKIEAIVDATGKLTNFDVNAPLVAYDASGNKVDVEIRPATIAVKVIRKDEKKEVE